MMNFLLPWQWMITATANQLFLIIVLNQNQIQDCHLILVSMAWEFVTPTTRNKIFCFLSLQMSFFCWPFIIMF